MHYKQSDYYFNNLKTVNKFYECAPADINLAVVLEKNGNGIGIDTENLDKTQSNIRDRFNLEAPNEDSTY